MARLFVRLKLSLIANGMRRGWQQALGLVVAALYSLPLALLAATGFVALGRRADLATVAGPVVVVVFAVLWLVWLLGPVLMFGLDETLDPARLRLLPLRRRQLLPGLLAASAVGIGPLASMIALGGVAVGFAPPGVGALVVVTAVVVQLVLCLVSARALTTALSRRLSSRKGRDLLTVVAAGSAGLFLLIGQLPNLVMGGGEGGDEAQALALLARVADGASVLPPAWPARAIVAAAGGELLPALGWLAAGVAAVALFAWWWMVALDRVGAGEGASGESDAAADNADLFPATLRWLPRNRFGAGVAKDLRYAWRVPQQRVQYLTSLVVLIPMAGFAISAGALAPWAVLAAPVVVLFVGLGALNQFGADRGAVWVLGATGAHLRTDLAAKSAVGALLALPLAVLVATGLAAATGGWEYLVPSVLLCAGAQGVVAAAGLLTSVYAPFPLPETQTNVFQANAGAGCSAMVVQLGAMTAEGILLLPVVGAVVLAAGRAPGLLLPVGLLAIGYGIVVWLVGLRIAASRLSAAWPEFVSTLSARTT